MGGALCVVMEECFLKKMFNGYTMQVLRTSGENLVLVLIQSILLYTSLGCDGKSRPSSANVKSLHKTCIALKGSLGRNMCSGTFKFGSSLGELLRT